MTLKIVLVAMTLNFVLLSSIIYMQFLIFRKVYGDKTIKEKNKRRAFTPEGPPKKRYTARDYPVREMSE